METCETKLKKKTECEERKVSEKSFIKIYKVKQEVCDIQKYYKNYLIIASTAAIVNYYEVILIECYV